MSEKDKVLQQISDIKTHLVDKEAFFPYNFNSCHVWSVIAVILTFVMIPAYEHSVALGTGVTFVMMVIGFIVEGIMTKKVNKSYEIDDCTRRQQFIMKNFIIISFFLIAFSAVLAMHKLYIPILLLWLSLISMGYMAIGFVINVKDYEKLAFFNIFMALLLVVVGMSFNLFEDRELFLVLVQSTLVFGLAIAPSLLAIKQKKNIKKGCSV